MGNHREDPLAALQERLDEFEARIELLEQNAHLDTGIVGLSKSRAADVNQSLPEINYSDESTCRAEGIEVAVTYQGCRQPPQDGTKRQDLTLAPTQARVENLSALLAALGQPARLRIVYHLLKHGPSERSTLQELIGTSSSGQLYHHLNTLLDVNIIFLLRRGVYGVRADKLTKLLSLLDITHSIAHDEV